MIELFKLFIFVCKGQHMIITMKDIAKEANVSLGTVSNVLNGKSNVSLAKIEKVHAAVEKLGYRKNIQASNLKSGVSNKVAIILPNITEMKYACLYENLELICTQNNLSLMLYLTHNREDKERNILKNITQDNFQHIIIDSCLNNAEYCYSELNDEDKFIFIYRNIQNAKHFVGFDYSPVFMDLIHHMQSHHLDNIIFIKDCNGDIDENACKYLSSITHENNINLSVFTQQESIHKLSFELAQGECQIDAIVVPSYETARVLYSSFYLSNKKPPRIYSFYKNSFDNDDRFFLYRLDYGFISNKISSILLDNTILSREYHFGFSKKNNFSSSHSANDEINLLAVQTPSIDAISKLLPCFYMFTGIKVNIDTYSFDDIPEVLEKNSLEHKYDLVRIDMESLPYFAQRYFLPLSNINVSLLEKFFSKSIVERFCLFQNDLYAIPFDPSIQMLFYREDIFNDLRVKRLFFEKKRKELNLPRNFEQFNILSDFFKNHLPQELGIKYGSALIMNDVGTLATEFLMRYYALTDSIFMNNILSLDMHAAKKALKQLKHFYSSAKLLENGWWKEAVEVFTSGQIPMLIVYMNHFLPLSQKGLMLPVGVSMLPNNRALMGGGSLAIIKQTTKIEACQKFLMWFLDNTTQEQYVQLGGSSAKKDIVENHNITQYLPWLTLALKGDFKGVRENSNSQQEAVNLRQAENIIGSIVNEYLITDITEIEAINDMNLKLSQI